jgi:2-deoxy-D-gluconate 3-dehydrogenase
MTGQLPRGLSAFDLTGRLAVVTGASRGIGMAMATALARAGADIVAVSATIDSANSKVQAAVEGAGRRCTAIRADFGDHDQVLELAGALRKMSRPVDILVNNAGTIAREPAKSHPDEMWAHVLQVNLTSQFTLTREVGTEMLERGHGKIIFTASLLSFQGGITVPSYAASKSGIGGLTRALANEWAPHGVNVNSIAPGYIETDNTGPLRRDPVRSKAIADRIPAGRWGVPGDLDGATVFLASAASDYVHGVMLPVDGGWLSR